MNINLRTTCQRPRNFKYALKPDCWKRALVDDQILGLDGPLDVQISIRRSGKKYTLDGRLTGKVHVRCDRCLEHFNTNIESKFRVDLVHASEEIRQEKTELLSEDMSINFITSEEINLDDIVREQVYLSLPMKLLCKDDCPGLCSLCGCNLNVERCDCHRTKGHPGFLELNKLRLKENKTVPIRK